ncbi:MAG: hypothetical protein FWE12_06780 [Oscillospiraceae bacterium]|nr:hypothetical protein [Oscillospiraceae bacterium]
MRTEIAMTETTKTDGTAIAIVTAAATTTAATDTPRAQGEAAARLVGGRSAVGAN